MKKTDLAGIYENIVKSISDSLIVTDLNTTITMVNRATLTLFGFNEDELLGKPLETLFDNEGEEDNTLSIEEILNTGKVINNKKICITKDGSFVPILFSASPVKDKEGTIQSIVCTSRDITDLINAENRLKKDKEVSDENNRAKSDYLAKISHEIRNHMNAVEGMTNLIVETTDLDNKYKEYVDAVHNSATWMLTLVNDILDYSKMEVGKLKLGKMDFDLRSTVEGVGTLLSQNAAAKGIDLVCLVHSNLPTVVSGDPWRLRQILINLASNALKFTEKGKILIQASLIDENDTDATIKFTVSDTGTGIPADKIKFLFEPYTQIKNESVCTTEGTGLGLAISRQLCELMGGEIRAESTIGEGSTFHFTIKLEKQNEVRPMIPLNAHQVAKLNVMVAADNEVNSKVLSLYFDSWDCKHNCITNIKKLPEKLHEAVETSNVYQLAIMDIYSPDDETVKLAQSIKNNALTKEIKLILMTSIANRGDAIKMEEAGFAAFLTKPVKKTQLYDCVEAVMGFQKTDKDGKYELITRHSLAERMERNRARILLVDDDDTIQMTVVLILEKAGFHVDVANNGKEAIDTLKNQFYDLVLMDSQMPVMNGCESTIEIRKLDGYARHVPIIALTATDISDDLSTKFINAGIDDYVTKPFENKDLINAINRLIDDESALTDDFMEIKEESSGNEVVFDKKAALNHVDGDVVFLRKITERFLDNYKNHLVNIKNAITKRDNKVLVHAVHAIKGAVGNIYAKAAFNAASKLETMGYSSDFDHIEQQVKVLEEEIVKLKVVLDKDLN